MNAVDDYLVTCEENDKIPEKPFKGTFNVGWVVIYISARLSSRRAKMRA